MEVWYVALKYFFELYDALYHTHIAPLGCVLVG